MRIARTGIAFAALLTLFLLSRPEAGHAVTRIVNNTDPTCSTASDPPCYTSITAAIQVSNITTPDNIVIEPGTYTESIVLDKDNLPIAGTDTAKTVIQSPGSDTVITANGRTGVNISKLTIVSSGVGISINNSAFVIANMIFWGRSQGTGIQVTGASSGQIYNNTFFKTATAINSTVQVTIQNNIFSGTGTSTALTGASFTNVTNNCFHNILNMGTFTYTVTSPLETNIPNPTHPAPADPLFVNSESAPPAMDMHLQEGSPCIETGATVAGPNSFNGSDNGGKTDIGAYGGGGADTAPFPISIISSAATATAEITVSWSENKSYVVTNTVLARQGKYRVYYSLNSAATFSASPFLESAGTTTIISGLTTTATAPAAPVLMMQGLSNQTLDLAWTAVPGASYYLLYFTDTDALAPVEEVLNVGNVLSYSLTGLTNGHTYALSVAAVAQATYYLAVTALDYNGHESALSPQQLVGLGAAAEGSRSSPVFEYPEAIVMQPNLPNKGCFIATAAYGSYLSPQVHVLRKFRDRYLMTTGPGRAFVAWYYRSGPAAAQFIEEHAWLKPVVRVCLLPVVAAAYVLVQASLPVRIAVILLLALLSVYTVLRFRKALPGGVR